MFIFIFVKKTHTYIQIQFYKYIISIYPADCHTSVIPNCCTATGHEE